MENFFGLSDHNKEEAKGYQVVLTDSLLRIEQTYIPYKTHFDPDVVFDSFFQKNGSQIIYYKAIDDVVYIFNQEGIFEKELHLDFGDNIVPLQYRINLTDFLSKYAEGYQYNCYSPIILNNYVLDYVKDKGEGVSFIYDLGNSSIHKNRKIDLFDDVSYPHSYINDSTFFSVISETVYPDYLSDEKLSAEQKKHLDEGGTILGLYTIQRKETKR